MFCHKQGEKTTTVPTEGIASQVCQHMAVTAVFSFATQDEQLFTVGPIPRLTTFFARNFSRDIDRKEDRPLKYTKCIV